MQLLADVLESLLKSHRSIEEGEDSGQAAAEMRGSEEATELKQVRADKLKEGKVAEEEGVADNPKQTRAEKADLDHY